MLEYKSGKLAIVLRTLIVLELLVYSAFALRCLDASFLGVSLIAVGGVLGVRLLITSVTYAYAWAYHSPSPCLSAWRAVSMFLAEWAAFICNFVLISPFEHLWMGADRLRPGDGSKPLLLIHGYGCSRAAWWWLRRRLEEAGWTVATISLEPIYTSIENYVEPVSQRIDEVLAKTNAQQVILIGHSMGGLVARAYLRRYGAAKVDRLITLGTPHSGSQLAKIGFGRNARQMTPGNPWLLALESVVPRVDTRVIYSPHDNYVMPQSNFVLPGAQHQTIDGLGHLSMLYSPRVVTSLLAELPQQTQSD